MIKPLPLNKRPQDSSPSVTTLDDLSNLADYSLMDTLNSDPDAHKNGAEHAPRQVFSGHYVPVTPTPIKDPEYVTHSKSFFQELGFADSLAQSADFVRMFSGDLTQIPAPLRRVGWASGYALSIYGNEYYQQCPFGTGNGYGDGRALSVLEAVINGQRWEMQLKGAGRTPYCRGADGRAVLRSSIREFLAQEHMQALGVPTTRSLSLYVSKTQKVDRQWYSQGSRSMNPDQYISEPIAISTRVAPSFIRVGQLELFGRRARKEEHPKALEELEMLVLHLIDREYADVIDTQLETTDKVLLLARQFSSRLSALVVNWLRVGYCQGNFNSDNCAAGGFTLDYGPFGFCELFSPQYQPWTGGGLHFSFFNQPLAAERNFQMFCSALKPLLTSKDASHTEALQQLDQIQASFGQTLQRHKEEMWASKLGLESYDEALFNELEALMLETAVDYTIFFRELSGIPEDIEPLKKSFYRGPSYRADVSGMDQRWSQWLMKWRSLVEKTTQPYCKERLATQMKLVNPKYSWREWFVVPAYQQAASGNYQLVRELQAVMTQPYAEQSQEIEDKYYRLKPSELFEVGGLSHYSCSS
ncbi:MAG: protein adenylyltransferase SelO family protein [Oceanospirillaceae bacterium]